MVYRPATPASQDIADVNQSDYLGDRSRVLLLQYLTLYKAFQTAFSRYTCLYATQVPPGDVGAYKCGLLIRLLRSLFRV